MRRLPRIALIVAGSLAGLVVVLVIAALIVVQTGWFRNFARAKIVQAVDESTGGRTEIGVFRFSPFQLRAEVDNFVLHGTEGPNAPPLVRARSIVIGVKIISVLARQANIDLLTIDQPQVYIEVKPDGTTNFPEPKVKKEKKSDPLQTVMDLAVRHFAIRNGTVVFANRKTPLNVRGDGLRVQMVYEALVPRYSGTLAIAAVHVQKADNPPLPVKTDIAFTLQRNRVAVTKAVFAAPESRVQFSGNIEEFSNPRGSVQLNARLIVLEIERTLGGQTTAAMRSAPPVNVELAAGLKQNALDIIGLQVSAGSSRFDASGLMTDLKAAAGSVRFDGRVVLGEVGRVLGLSARPKGTVLLSGSAKLAGTDNYAVNAKLDARDVSFQSGATRIAGVNASAGIDATPKRIALNPLHLSALGGDLNGSGELADMDRYRLDAELNNFNTRYLARTYASKNVVWDGIISGPVRATGRLKGGRASRELVANANLRIRPGRNGVPLSGRLDISYDGPRDQINLGNSFVQLPATRLTLAGAIGQQLRIQLVSRNLNDFLPAIALASSNPPQSLPVTLARDGVAGFDGTVSGPLANPRIDGRVSLTNFIANGQRFDRLAADLDAQKTGANVRNAVLMSRGTEVQANASVGLVNWKPVDTSPLTANLSAKSANIQELLAAAGKGDTRFSGALNVNAGVTGTVGDPRGKADLNLVNGKAGDEPFDRVRAHVDYSGQLVRLTDAQIALPAGHVDLNAEFRHPPKQFQTGNIQFEVTSTPIQLAGLHTLTEKRPGIRGVLRLGAKGSAGLDPPAPNRPRIRLAMLKADVNARSVAINGRRVGDVTLAANTSGQDLTFRLDSDVAESSIHGSGKAVLSGDYPVEATVTFNPIRLAPVVSLAKNQPAPDENWNGSIEGRLTVNGPALRPEALKGELRLDTVQVETSVGAVGGPRKAVAVRNAGPVVLTLDRQIVRIQNARLTGPSTNIGFSGTAAVAGARALNIQTNGNIGLELAQLFSPDIYSAGNIVLNAGVRGTTSEPVIDGKLQLVNASVNYLDSPNGLSDANGTILFSGTQAVIQNLTGESGGGKVSLRGVVRYGAPQMDFRLRASAERVRVRSSNISVQVNAGLDLAGTTESSILSGDVTIEQVAVHSHTDFGSVLSQGGAPPNTPEAKTGMLAGMRLDIRVATAPSVQFVTSLTQNLQADAQLQVRGTAAQPGLLGRVNVTQGDIVFFGSKYTIDQGTVNFYNPARIAPVLAVDLTTQARGIEVTLSVRGSMDNLKLTYHSDPPLQFSDIVQLLATGKAPTSDPVLAANQPPAPEQNWQQMGASAVLGQAVANPVSGRLQRLFGVTKLKIDPQLIGPSNTMEAKMTLQQQISRELTFTYIQDVRESNPQVIQIEWAIDPTWSAVALRQENGQFGVDFYYKKRFR